MAKLILQNQTEPASPDTGCTTLYVDSADGKVKAKDSNGCVYSFATNDDVSDIKYHNFCVLIVAGGGGGGYWQRCDVYGCTMRNCLGGGGGDACNLIMKLDKGCSYPVIVGIGGTASCKCCTTGQYSVCTAGCDGGYSCFNGICVNGGYGGITIIDNVWSEVGGKSGNNCCASSSCGVFVGGSSAGDNGKNLFDPRIGGNDYFGGGGGGHYYCYGGSTTDKYYCGGCGCKNCGGGGDNNSDGKCGIVIISYPESYGISVTGGTITCNGGYKIHTFTSDGTLCIN